MKEVITQRVKIAIHGRYRAAIYSRARDVKSVGKNVTARSTAATFQRAQTQLLAQQTEGKKAHEIDRHTGYPQEAFIAVSEMEIN